MNNEADADHVDMDNEADMDGVVREGSE